MTAKSFSIWFRDAHTPSRIYRGGANYTDRSLAVNVLSGTDGMLFLEGSARNVFGGLVLPAALDRAAAEQRNAEWLT